MSDREILPTDLKPVNYKLNVFDIDLDKYTYQGSVVIDYKCQTPTDLISLNHRSGLTINESSIKIEGQSGVSVTSVTYESNEVLKISLNTKITQDFQVKVEFSALVQDNMAGFYRSRYQQDGQDKVMLSTQFESTDARRAFPCADEPNLKASLEFSIEIPVEWTALSNMPVLREQTCAGNEHKKLVEFEKSPIMSTYLFAWACGEFEYIESFTEKLYNGKPLPVRVYTTPGLKNQGQLALESATKILDFFSNVFEIDYVLPKCDLLAAHEFTHGAMENWGMIVYRTTAVLFDEETSDPYYKQRVVYVVAHELAHQWFGDLVTMDWWEELWLNEGFATWVGWLAVDHLYPEWDVFSQFVSESLQSALTLDALRGSHPIEVPVKNGAEIDQIFDSISYLKGASSIRMLSTHLGVDVFLKGVAKYLAKHQFGNAKTTDLWAAIAEVSGVDVASIMHHWTRSLGFPVVTVEQRAGSDDIEVRQDRFLSAGGVTDEDNKVEWWVPLAISTAEDNNEELSKKSLFDRSGTLKGLAKQQFFKLNKDQVGVYRVNYPEALLNNIGDNVDKLSIRDKIGLVGDAASTAAAGIGSSVGLLSFIRKLVQSGEKSYYVWTEVIARLRSIRAAWSANDTIIKSFDKFCLELIKPMLDQFTWETSDDSDYIWIQFRALIIGFALDLGDASSVSEAKARFSKLLSGDTSAMHPSLKKHTMCAVVANSSGDDLKQAYDYIMKEIASSATVDGREQAAVAAGCVQDPSFITTSFDAFIKGAVVRQDAHSLINSLMANRASRAAVWQLFKDSWDEITKRYVSNLIIFERIVRLTISHFSTKSEYEDVESFFSGKDLTGFDRGIDQSKDSVKVRYQWVSKDTESVQKWLESAIN